MFKADLATVMRDDVRMTNRVAESALNVTAVIVDNVDEAARVGQLQNIVDDTVSVFGVASQLLSVDEDEEPQRRRQLNAQSKRLRTRKEKQDLALMIKASADNFCDSLPSNSAP